MNSNVLTVTQSFPNKNAWLPNAYTWLPNQCTMAATWLRNGCTCFFDRCNMMI
jgi:hypothetical protein